MQCVVTVVTTQYPVSLLPQRCWKAVPSLSLSLHPKDPDRREEGNNLCVLPSTITEDRGFFCLPDSEMGQMPLLTFRERDIIKPPHWAISQEKTSKVLQQTYEEGPGGKKRGDNPWLAPGSFLRTLAWKCHFYTVFRQCGGGRQRGLWRQLWDELGWTQHSSTTWSVGPASPLGSWLPAQSWG